MAHMEDGRHECMGGPYRSDRANETEKKERNNITNANRLEKRVYRSGIAANLDIFSFDNHF